MKNRPENRIVPPKLVASAFDMGYAWQDLALPPDIGEKYIPAFLAAYERGYDRWAMERSRLPLLYVFAREGLLRDILNSKSRINTDPKDPYHHIAKRLTAETKDFHALIDKDYTDCWRWKGETNSSGYGQFCAISLNGTVRATAHRYAAIYSTRETPPPGCHIHHSCRYRLCVKPCHLQYLQPDQHRAVTEAQYQLDRALSVLSGADIEAVFAKYKKLHKP